MRRAWKTVVGWSVVVALLGSLTFLATVLAFPAGNVSYLAYVPNAAEGTVSVVDLGENEVVKTLKIGTAASHGVALSPDSRTLYVGDGEFGRVFAVDVKTGETVQTYETRSNAHGIDISPDGRYVLVGSGGTTEEPSLVRIDTQTRSMLIVKDGINPPGHIEFSPDGERLFVANLLTDSLSVIDVATMQVERVIPVGDGPNESRVTPDGRWIYVANWNSHDVSVIDTGTWSVVETLKVGEGTHGVAVTPDGKDVWIANRISNDVVILEGETHQVKARLQAGEYANHLAFTPDGERALVTNARANELMIFDANDHRVVARIAVGIEPHEISVGSAIN